MIGEMPQWEKMILGDRLLLHWRFPCPLVLPLRQPLKVPPRYSHDLAQTLSPEVAHLYQMPQWDA